MNLDREGGYRSCMVTAAQGLRKRRKKWQSSHLRQGLTSDQPVGKNNPVVHYPALHAERTKKRTKHVAWGAMHHAFVCPEEAVSAFVLIARVQSHGGCNNESHR